MLGPRGRIGKSSPCPAKPRKRRAFPTLTLGRMGAEVLGKVDLRNLPSLSVLR